MNTTAIDVIKWETKHNKKLPALKKYIRNQKVKKVTDPMDWNEIEIQMTDIYKSAMYSYNQILEFVEKEEFRKNYKTL